MIQKILITNRGEIAVRIIRTCREQGIKSVAVFSDVDRTAPHVLKADEAYPIGPAPSAESYLNVSRILEVMQASAADAVHPGYGFLSENAEFAETVIRAGLKWIGPSPDAIRLMGDKMAARNLAASVKAPVVPGTTEPISDIRTALETADEIGFPVLVKAAGGGGGKGMRIVSRAGDLEAAVNRARSEAVKAFSDDRIYIEKYLEEPHHIEIQVFADTQGRVISLGERECSIQRRYQKIIEETPSPFIDDQLRRKLSDTAVEITRACRYTGAGTVEFLVDKYKNYYFLEMNTRLQVEHPVTEMVIGFDLVKEQLNVAEGKPLSFPDKHLHPRGHAVECRIYAENGFNNFAPSIGKILELDFPQGPGVRLDEGVRAGQEITPYYDPLLGKLITWGQDRSEAVERMLRALQEFHVVGIETSIPYCLLIIGHESFRSGNYCTKTLEEIGSTLEEQGTSLSAEAAIAAAVGAIRRDLINTPAPAARTLERPQNSPWSMQGRKDGLR
ncbi:MAG: acetyl-CoA carboxylase biotin carboxylase subunit [FCB group bacterium]|nr:acetyl-CoA carboxylase biotin carboxylase subunit [FCB group bacterium]